MTEYEYEWVIEELDGYGEVVDIYHSSQLDNDEIKLIIKNSACAIGLVRDNDNGRAWAYVVDGKLNVKFKDANDIQVGKVPQKYIKEFSKNRWWLHK